MLESHAVRACHLRACYHLIHHMMACAYADACPILDRKPPGGAPSAALGRGPKYQAQQLGGQTRQRHLIRLGLRYRAGCRRALDLRPIGPRGRLVVRTKYTALRLWATKHMVVQDVILLKPYIASRCLLTDSGAILGGLSAVVRTMLT